MPTSNNILPKVNLANASFTPATFQGTVFTPQQADISLLARSLDKIEEREEKLATQRLALGEAFSKARELLPDNAETNQYITDNQNRIRDNINAMINARDYAGAISSAKRLAGDFISSPEYNARIKEHKSRKEWIEQLDNSNVDNYIKEYYKDTYQDRNNFTRDANGNITGTAGWEAPLPEQGQSATAIIQMAVKATADERQDGANSWTTATGTGGHDQFKREWLTADRISQTAKSIVNNDGRVKQAFIDQFNAGIHQITKLGKQIDKLNEQLRNTTNLDDRAALERQISAIDNQIAGYKSSYYKNGAPMESAEAYINNLFSADNDEIKNASYDYKHSNKGRDNYTGRAGAGNGGNGGTLSPGFRLSAEAGDIESEDFRSNGQSTRRKTDKLKLPSKTVRPTGKKQ